SNAAPINVPMQIPASTGHSRRASAHNSPPTAACQILVTSDGTTRIAAACAGVINSPNRPMDTVGSPRPMTPLTNPASRKAPAVAIRSPTDSTRQPFPNVPTLRDVAFFHNADGRNPGSYFREAALWARYAVRCHSFPTFKKPEPG